MEKIHLTCGIIDDEFYALETLKMLIKEACPHVTVKWTAQHFREAVHHIKEDTPDFVFLDIELPEKNGFDILREVQDRNFDVVFITAYDQYAIQAFKFHAVDYLLKPIGLDQLSEAVDRIEKNKQLQRKNWKHTLDHFSSAGYPSKICINTTDSFLYLKLEEIVMLEGEGSYSQIYCTDGKRYTVSRGLGDLERVLPPNNFFRTHKSQIVSLEHVRTYNRETNIITLQTGVEATLSRRRKKEFLSIMNGARFIDE